MLYTTADNIGDGSHSVREKLHIYCLWQAYAGVRKHMLFGAAFAGSNSVPSATHPWRNW